MNEYKLSIQDNNLSKAVVCPICGEEFEPSIGPQAFIAGTWDPVCIPCSNKYLDPCLWLGRLVAHHAFKMLRDDSYIDEKYLPVDSQLARNRRAASKLKREKEEKSSNGSNEVPF